MYRSSEPANHKHNVSSTQSSSHGDTTSPSHSPPTIQMMLQSKDSFKSQQAMEWSRLLFQCIKPVGEPEFRLNGDIGEGVRVWRGEASLYVR